MIKYLAIALSIFLLINCSKQKQFKKIDGKTLKSLVTLALNGDIEANKKLSGLNDERPFVTKNFSLLEIDSALVGPKKIYTIAVEYPDPLYNFFALYDDNLKFYLLDKSVNGKLNIEWKEVNDKKLLFVQENFNSQKILELERISIYALIDTSMNLVYRSFSKLRRANAEYNQVIDVITDSLLVTSISTSGNAQYINGSDFFRYDQYLKIYTSRDNKFTSFVVNEINKLNRKKTNGTTTQTNREIAYTHNGYSINLSDEWREILDFTITKNVKKEVIGFRYVNNSLGANISVIKLKDNELSSDYTDLKFGEPTKGNYTVRATGIIEKDNLYIQFYEHSCGGNKFLLLFESSRFTYEQSKDYYDSILDSFFIEC